MSALTSALGTFETSRDIRSSVAIGGKADISQIPISVAFDPLGDMA
jgi:hypothetical protein